MSCLKPFSGIFVALFLLCGPTATHTVPRNSKNDHSTPDQIYDLEIPESFDAREKWPFCESIGKIRDQQNCNAGWAFASAEVMTDRLCIQSNGSVKIEFSPQNLLSCCEDCGGCNAGNVAKAWDYWINHGGVSGGDNNGLNEGCMPYSDTTGVDKQIPPCQNHCQSDYHEDRYFADNFYFIKGLSDPREIQVEIMTKGPVQAEFIISEDFYSYKNGVYDPGPDSGFVSHTSVKILGWGVEDGTPYWLAALSWGANWGDLKGFFKVLRGENAAGIEATVIGGVVIRDLSPVSRNSAPSLVSVRSMMSWSIVCLTFWLVLMRL